MTESTPQVVYVQSAPTPANHAHGAGYWLLVGWWWGPLKWLGRVSLWVLLLPVGIWRSWANHSNKKRLRAQRGAKAAK